MFDVEQKSSEFFLEIMTLVPSANIMGSVKVFIVFIVGGSFMYIIKSKGPRIDPCFIVPQFEEKF
jgi:hypothetical protein